MPTNDHTDDYVQETQSSVDDRRSSDSELEDSNTDDFFIRRTYTCKADVVVACSDYNTRAGRAYVVKSSDYRRYRVACADEQCEFVVNFAFGREFGPPTQFRVHTCDPTQVDHDSYGAQRALKPQFLSRNKVVRQFVIDNGREASPRALQDLLCSSGHDVSYHNCADACAIVKAELFESDRLQFQLIISYVQELIKRGHKADVDLDGTTIRRVVVVYRQGIQVTSVFADRGLNMDGTFMKHSLGGTLLVACLRNSNSEIQIVAVAWVSGETKDNWSWFLDHLLKAITRPAFAISDRDKGLIPALEQVAPGLPHLFCLRHFMENFNTKFRNKALRNAGWKLGKALTPIAYTKRSDELAELNQKAVEWMEAVDKTKWAAAYSPCIRFGTMTSNNVESVNSALIDARQEPLLDCLMTIEKYVCDKWVEFTGKTTKWGPLTDYAEKKFVGKRLARGFDGMEVFPRCSSSFNVKVKKDGQLPIEYAIDLDKTSDPCSCGYFQHMDAPCVHVAAALKHTNNLSKLREFIGKSWTTDTYKQAYDPSLKMHPTVTKDELLRFEHHQPPPVPQKRGRPKNTKKRIESQPASLALSKKSTYTCSACGGRGHNKRSCSKK